MQLSLQGDHRKDQESSGILQDKVVEFLAIRYALPNPSNRVYHPVSSEFII